ncbi:Linker histone H1/H5 domain H15 [Arabidopsis thaliana x Arabidopsis arenosa]|uniref:Linker histone H1/H5 domain H15 n=1 Tax=Arabidopsis thaliana x Arabidopsis arenosa TaxID=1240361 RepID=A0A8T2B1Q3_9BRAS|nr:Linker histone H1/H5 domain H15 [Arabidopsis thaliana x Arabidopsis arenosa]
MAEEKILKKTPAAKKPRKPKTTTHPPYFEMIKEALMALKEKNGSSPYAIAKKIEEKHKPLLPESFRKILSLQLKNSVTKGKLVKIRASYKQSRTNEIRGPIRICRSGSAYKLSDTTKMTTRLQDKKSKKNMKQEDKEITKRTRSSSTRSKKSMSVNKQEKMRKAKKARQPKSIKSSAGKKQAMKASAA